MIVLHPTYFPNVTSFAAITQNKVCWEIHDNYQKQTYRNRIKVCTDRGLHILSIPIVHVGNTQGRQLYSEVKIDNTYNWQRQHWRTLETAYRTSPFFEFYEDEIHPLYDSKFEYLQDFNLRTIETICEFLQIEMPTMKTQKFQVHLKEAEDYRFLVNSKKELQLDYAPYHQVFGNRHGFITNLSILDLLFNIGPETSTYLSKLILEI